MSPLKKKKKNILALQSTGSTPAGTIIPELVGSFLWHHYALMALAANPTWMSLKALLWSTLPKYPLQ